MKAEAKVAVDTVACLNVSVHRLPTPIGSRKKSIFTLPEFYKFRTVYSHTGFCL